MIMYKKMIQSAKAQGLANEKVMWQSIEDVEELLELIKEEHPDEYWEFLRKQHGKLFNGHYDEVFAKYDVERLKPIGEKWSRMQIEEATRSLTFPTGTTPWDKYVAFNVWANDLYGTADDATLIKQAHAFFFADVDWPPHCNKLWKYMMAATKK